MLFWRLAPPHPVPAQCWGVWSRTSAKNEETGLNPDSHKWQDSTTVVGSSKVAKAPSHAGRNQATALKDQGQWAAHQHNTQRLASEAQNEYGTDDTAWLWLSFSCSCAMACKVSDTDGAAGPCTPVLPPPPSPWLIGALAWLLY